MPGWVGSNRKAELPDDWPKRRRERLQFDGHVCQHVREDTGRKCGAYANQVDHITAGGSDEQWNLQSLCQWHHLRKSGSEGGLASREARRRKTTLNHPGYIA